MISWYQRVGLCSAARTARFFPHRTESTVKVVVGVVVALFVGMWLVQSPQSLAAVTQGAASALWDATTAVFDALRQFLTALFR